jgi:hypothetical protein
MKLKIGLVVLVLTMTAGVAMADPIPDSGWINAQVGWFWNVLPIGGGAQACPAVCNFHGGVAEKEIHAGPGGAPWLKTPLSASSAWARQ